MGTTVLACVHENSGKVSELTQNVPWDCSQKQYMFQLKPELIDFYEHLLAGVLFMILHLEELENDSCDIWFSCASSFCMRVSEDIDYFACMLINY